MTVLELRKLDADLERAEAALAEKSAAHERAHSALIEARTKREEISARWWAALRKDREFA